MAAALQAAGLSAYYAQDADQLARGTVAVFPGALSAGMEWPGAFFGLLTHGHLQTGRRRKTAGHKKHGSPISSLAELSPGHYVAHESHGIGVYDGIRKLDMNGVTKDYP